jgi:hypothetical protein
VLGPDRAVAHGSVVMNTGLKKLLKLKDWLTVPDAARHLSILFGVDVSEADVLRLALDGRLTLSVYFVNRTAAQCGKIVAPPADDERKEGLSIKDGFGLSDGRVFLSIGKITSIQGVWDLPMISAEKSAVEHKYQQLTGGPEVEMPWFVGPVVNRPDGTCGHILKGYPGTGGQYRSPSGDLYILPYEENYGPADALPSDAVFVVRTSALQELEALMSEPETPTERPFGRRERNTLLVIIAGLAELAKVDVAKPSKAAAVIESATIRMGARVAARTIEDKLKLVPEALESKAED